MILPPPKLTDLRYGHILRAGMGLSGVIADIDFETYSPAGFVWNEDQGKFKPLPGASKKGLPTVGAAVYSMHPEAEVLSCAYDLKDGLGARVWTPDMPPPRDLFAHIAKGWLIEAWNVRFEYWIWKNVCVPKYQWPMVDVLQLRDAAAKARAFALPGSLDPAGEVLNIQYKKLKDGKRLINKFSIPRNPTLKNKTKRLYPLPTDKDTNLLYEYNKRDILAEAEISSQVPDLMDDELQFWFCDQAINTRGVQLDALAIYDCKTVLSQAYAKYNIELSRLTNGAVTAASQVAKLQAWMNSYGVFSKKLDNENIEELLKIPSLAPEVRRALEIRSLIGSAAVKKLNAMTHQMTPYGRTHDLFIYHSARTGRAAGTGAQPQNFPNSGEEVKQCVNEACKKHFCKDLNFCVWCGADATKAPLTEWNHEAVNDALEILSTRSVDCVEYYFGDAVATISGCLRGMLISAPGHDLICSDYSAIEAVVLALLAGEEWRIEVFRTHGKIYEMSASKITGMDFDEYLLYKATSGKHHSDRKIGKVAELACFAPDTQVLTDRGYVAIVDVLKTDKLWDGVEWVNHEGAIEKQPQATIDLDGVRMTLLHPINLKNSWMPATILALNVNTLYRALAIGSENLPTSVTMGKTQTEIDSQNASVLVDRSHRLRTVTCVQDVLLGAINALKKLQDQRTQNGLSITGNMRILYRVLKIVDAWEEGYQQLSEDAIAQLIHHTRTMADEVSPFMTVGEEKKEEENSLDILQQFLDGITRFSKWIELIAIEDTNLEISDSYLDQKTNLINERLAIYRNELKNLNPVYDIVNAGKRNRFTIKTNSGHLIVHNSGYQGWIGAWKAFKADAFMNEEDMKNAILAWRKASPNIVEFWGGQPSWRRPDYYGLEGAAVQAVMMPGREFSHRGITYIVKQNILYCRLLSGRYLTYHRPLLSPSEKRPGTLALSFEGWNTNPKMGQLGWIRMSTYGGKLTENVVQATARDILAHAIINLEKNNYPVVLHVHDEIVAEVPEDFGSIEEFEEILSTMPYWAKDWPIKASGGWRSKRYRK